MRDNTCAGTKADGTPCGKSPRKGSDYCQYHGPDDEAEGRRAERQPDRSDPPLEDQALESLRDVLETSRGPGSACRAAEAILEHVRWQEGQG